MQVVPLGDNANRDTGLQEGLQVDYVIRGRVAAAAGGRLTIDQPILCHSRESREPTHQPARLQLIHSSERRGATYFQFKICCKFIQRWHKMCCCKCCKGSRHKLETGNLTRMETRPDHQKWVQPAFQEKTSVPFQFCSQWISQPSWLIPPEIMRSPGGPEW